MANNIVYVGTISSDEPIRLALAGLTEPDSTDLIKRPSDTPIMVFQYITSGRGVFMTGSRKYKPTGGDFFIAPSHREHMYYPDSHDPWGKVWINVTGSLPEELLRVYGISEHYYFPGCHEAGIQVAKMVKEIPHIPEEKMTDFISHRVLNLVMTLAKFTQKHEIEVEHQNEAALELRDYLRTRIAAKPPSLKEMSKKIGLSPVQTIRVFNNEFSTTPYAYLLNEKINVATEMLANAENSIKEIAEILGFSNEYYFSRIFKQKKGVPPGTFRRNAHK